MNFTKQVNSLYKSQWPLPLLNGHWCSRYPCTFQLDFLCTSCSVLQSVLNCKWVKIEVISKRTTSGTLPLSKDLQDQFFLFSCQRKNMSSDPHQIFYLWKHVKMQALQLLCSSYLNCLLLFVLQKSCVIYDLDVVSLNESKKRSCCGFWNAVSYSIFSSENTAKEHTGF